MNNSGICAMMNLEHYDLGVNMMEKYSENDIGHIRMKYVNDMVFCDQNIATVAQSKIKEVM
jgi:hypothetical protein